MGVWGILMTRGFDSRPDKPLAFMVSTANTAAWYAAGPGSIPGEGSTDVKHPQSSLAGDRKAPSGTSPKPGPGPCWPPETLLRRWGVP